MTMHYEEPLFRPPSEAQSLILQASIGCSHNRCAFCGMYKAKRFRVRPVGEIRDEIRQAKAVRPGTRKIFLADGDALVLDTGHLLEILDLLNASFPELSRVGLYVNAENVLSKTDEELRLLSARKVRIGYLGLESGYDELLAEMKKGVTAAEMIEAVRRCQAAGIKMSVMVLLGLGGTERSRVHALETAQVLNRMQPRFLSFLTLMPVEGTPLFRWIKTGDFTELTPSGILREMKWLVEGLDLRGTIFRSNHASNYLAIAGRFPQDKTRILSEMEECLTGKKRFREEWERGL
jgi:radical SAM superfamily enzyme YgiQ (UPF0313 family)